MKRFKEFLLRHKGKIIFGVITIAGVAYLYFKKKDDPVFESTGDDFLMFVRELAPGENAIEVAKSIMGPDTIVTQGTHWWSAALDFALPGNSKFTGALIQ